MGFRFAEPIWLLLLPLTWILCWRIARSPLVLSAWRRVCDARLLELMGVSGSGPDGARWLAWPMALLLGLGVLALAAPGWRATDLPSMQSAAARVIVLDLSRAMLVQDIKPNRYAHARAAAIEIIDSGFDGETAFVVYAGAVFTVAPLTRDAATLKAFLDALEPGLVPVDGARVDLAIDRAAELLGASITGRGQILVLGSGVDDISAASRSAKRARDRGHQVSLMALGSSAGGPRVAPDGSLERDEQGRYRLAKTDSDAMARIAENGGGRFASVNSGFGAAYLLDATIDAQKLIESDDVPDQNSGEQANEGYWLVWLMLPFLLLLFRRNLVYGCLIALLLAPLPEAYCADWNHPWQNDEKLAWQAWAQGDYRLAGQLSSAPLLKGAALYRDGQMRQALQAFGQLDEAEAHYNRGNTLVRLKRYVEAVAAYQVALQHQPAHRSARYNQRLVKLFLQNQQESGGRDPADPGGADPDAGMEPPRDNNGAGAGLQPLDSADNAPQVDGGDGASMPSGLYNPLEAYSGRDTPPLQSGPGDMNSNAAQAEIQQWISRLPATATELFERKFLRDYRRGQQGAR